MALSNSMFWKILPLLASFSFSWGQKAGSSSIYYFKYFPTSGSISTWYTNDSSWGVKSPSGTGYVAMVTGEDWGTTSPQTTLPKKLSNLSPSHYTAFNQVSTPASGAGYDATYDIFIDSIAGVTNRNSKYEIMIWVGYKAPNAPLSSTYNAAGHPQPYATNVTLAGKKWDVYTYNWSGGGMTMSYLDTANSGSFAGQLTDFFNYGVEKGWYQNSYFLNSVQAGWEFGHGNYEATKWSATGF